MRTSFLLGLLGAVFVGGAILGGAAWSSLEKSGTTGGDAPSPGSVRNRSVDREELKQALLELGLRVQDGQVRDAPSQVEVVEGVPNGEGRSLSEVLAHLEASYRAGLQVASGEADRREGAGTTEEEIGVMLDPANLEPAAIGLEALDQVVLSEAEPSEIEEGSGVSNADERQMAQQKRVRDSIEEAEGAGAMPDESSQRAVVAASESVFQGPVHIGDVHNHVSTAQQVAILQQLYFQMVVPSSGAPTPTPPTRGRREATAPPQGQSVFRPVDLNAHYVNPFSPPPAWVNR